MRLNENVAISTPKTLLVPYDAHHVATYHEWMQNPAIQEATASEPLTLEEEYENQISWRTSHDKLTFIICKPIVIPLSPPRDQDQDKDRVEVVRDSAHAGRARSSDDDEWKSAVSAGEADTPNRMIGDVNLFLSPWDDDDKDNTESKTGGEEHRTFACRGEVDIMIADPTMRGRGLGKAAVMAFLTFMRRNLEGVLGEYGKSLIPHIDASPKDDDTRRRRKTPRLRDLVAKIKVNNKGSIALFKSLGFEQEGGVNYFGEIHMALQDLGIPRIDEAFSVGEYEELVYDRSRKQNPA